MEHKPEIYDIPLHDIKTIVEIPEYSLYYLIAFSLGALFLLAVLIYFIMKYLKKKNAFNIRVEHLKLLNQLEFSDSKKAAYDTTYYAATFKNDSELTREKFLLLESNLELYKYRKYVNSFDDETKKMIKDYIGMLNV